MMFYKRPVHVKICITLVALSCWCAVGFLAVAQGATHLLITEVSLHHPEFIEIYNPMDQAVSLQGFWFGYYPSKRTSWDTPWRSKAFPAEAAIQPHGFFLVTLGDDELGQSLLTDWNAFSSKMIRGEGGAVAILNAVPGRGDVVDAVGWGDSCLSVGNAAAAAPEGKALARLAGTSRDEPFHDEGDNARDFHHALPSPSSARSGIVIISDGFQIMNRTTSMCELSLFNAGPVSRSFAIAAESEFGYAAMPQQPTMSLARGEWGTIKLLRQPYSYYVVDLETSGLDSSMCSIIEAAWIHVFDGEVVQSDSSLIFLGEDLDPYITQITGITSEMLEFAPSADEIIPLLFNDIVGSPVLSYSTNAFDRRFLEATAASLGEELPAIQWIDVFSLTRRALPDLPSHSLQAVTEFLGIDDCHHRALADSLMTNLVFQQAVLLLGSQLVVTIHGEDSALPVGVYVLPLDPF